jgi:HlyD family secretion protein
VSSGNAHRHHWGPQGRSNLNLNVYESDISQVHIGQEVQGAFYMVYRDQTFAGIVKRISSKPSFATKKATSNNEDDVLAYEVKVVVT